MMGKVLYAKGQLKKAYVSWLRRYWRTRKEKTKPRKYGSFFLSKLWNDVHTASQILNLGDLRLAYWLHIWRGRGREGVDALLHEKSSRATDRTGL